MPRPDRGWWSSCLLTALTWTAWAAIVAGAGWVLIALGWWLISTLWLTEVFVPGAVTTTIRFFFLLLVWAAVVAVLSEAWRWHDFVRYHCGERRERQGLGEERGWVPWAEAELDAETGELVVVARAGGGSEPFRESSLA